MKTLYHVVKNWDGLKLESLYKQCGESAYNKFCKKWECDISLAQYHAHYIHLYSTLEDAKQHQQIFGGDILAVEVDEYTEVEVDTLEFEHPMIRDEVPEELIRRV